MIILHIKLVHSKGNMDPLEFKGPLATFGSYQYIISLEKENILPKNKWVFAKSPLCMD